MMPFLPQPKAKLGEPTRYQSKAAKVAAMVANERDVYARVTERDGSSCRVCGKFCNPRAVGLLTKAHHHHIEYRSAGGLTTRKNCCILCARCHDDEHQHVLRLSGDADLRDAMGRLCGLTIERCVEEGWRVVKTA